jgi:MFS family permease
MNSGAVSSVVTTKSFDGRQVATLGGAMLGFFVESLDAQIVNVALPDMGAALGGGLSGLQWVVTGYTLTFSGLILSPGSCPTGSGLDGLTGSVWRCSLRRWLRGVWQ